MAKEIKIIKGVFGYKKGNVTIPKTKNDKPFTVDDKIAQRLIARGVAVLAEEKATEAEPIVKYSVNLAKKDEKVVKKADEKEAEVSEDKTEGKADEPNDELSYGENNTKDELLEILEQTGYEITAATKRLNKSQLIALIDEQGADEDTPEFNGDDGVVD